MRVVYLLLILSGIGFGESKGQSAISLRRSFIDSFMNRVTITSSYDVWYTHHRAKAAREDGDIHFSGYDKKIGMPVVAEIMNAKDEGEAIDSIIAHEGKGKANNPKLAIEGVWRLWPEHMGAHAKFYQGMKLTKAQIQSKTTNPDHVFEIHPVTKLADIDLTGTLRNIDGYEPKQASVAFTKIKQKAFTITSATKTISFSTSMIGYNYIDLWMRIDSMWQVDDGSFVYARIFDSDFDPDSDGEDSKVVSSKTRVAFAAGTEPYALLQDLEKGAFLHLLGTPRINLAILSWREWMMDRKPEVKTWMMPVEIIAAGIFE